jgi:hypothetical protein
VAVTASVDSNGTMGEPPPFLTLYRQVNGALYCIAALEIVVPETTASIIGIKALTLV